MPAPDTLHDIGFDAHGQRIFVVPTRAMYPMLRAKAVHASVLHRRAVSRNLSDRLVESAVASRWKFTRAALAARVAGVV